MLIDSLPERVSTMFLDMNGTFMFGHDRLGAEQDFFPAYQAHGGSRIACQPLNTAVRRVIDQLDVLYKSGAHDTNFPQVLDIAREVLVDDVEEDDLVLIEKTIASHEFGQVSDSNARALEALSKSFRLYILSNLWSQSAPWKNYLIDRLGDSTFSGWVFSSDVGINKPAREIFEQALTLADVDPAEVVMVGDDIERDMRPAVELGMKTVWVSQTSVKSQLADHNIADICLLV